MGLSSDSYLIRLNIGSGFKRIDGFTNLDRRLHYDKDGKCYTDIVVDIERERLPFDNNSVAEIACYEVLEHLGFHTENPDRLEALLFAMNEMWRVLSPGGFLKGKVPSDDGPNIFCDPTHKRVFTYRTFAYFTGVNSINPWLPSRPHGADYGIKPWYQIYLDKGINFTLRPRKTAEYVKEMEVL